MTRFKDFPPKIKACSLLLVLLLISGGIFSCKKKSTNTNVNTNCVYTNASQQQVNYTILSGSGQFFPLNVVGGFIYINGYGYQQKGILVYRLSQTQFMAYDRNCTHDGCNNAQATIKVQTGNTACKDSICGSVYNIFDGSIQTGPAVVPLFQYHTSWDGNQLRIYN